MKGQVGGCFGKTEKKKVKEDIEYVKNLQVKFSKETEMYLNIYSADEERTQLIRIQLADLEKREIKTIKTNFGDQQSFLQGEIECSYEFLKKEEKEEKENIDKKVASQMMGYNDNFRMKEEVKTKAAEYMSKSKRDS